METPHTEMPDADEAADDIEVERPPDLPEGTVVIFPNPEKQGRVKLGREEFMPYVTSRILLSGPPGSGKRNVILNLVRRMIPPPSHCHIVHCDPYTTEYDVLSSWGIPFTMYAVNDFPTLKNIEDPDDARGMAGSGVEKDKEEDSSEDEKPAETISPNPLVIVDEITADSLGTRGNHRFERLVNHVCTHRNTTLLCSIQSASNLRPMVRRGFNHYVMWKQPDIVLNKILAHRAGIHPDVLEALFSLTHDPHEFVWIDLDSPKDSQWRYRVMFEPVAYYPHPPANAEAAGDKKAPTEVVSTSVEVT